MDSRIKRTATAIAVATVLAMPGVALAQTDAEKALEARVAELEKLVQQMSAQQAAAPATTAAQPAEEKKAPEPTVKTGGGEMLTIKGFIIGSLYAQDANFTFGNGQNAEFPSSEFARNSWILGGDVRNTRVTFGFNGPDVAGMKVGGTLELDFFAGFAAGAFGDEAPIPRLRLAYADVTKGDTTFRVGQAWSPLFGNVPVSPTHVAFPLGYGSAGDVGWRFPGLFIYHNINKDLKLTFAAMRGSWNGPGDVTNGTSAGESGTPQFEARVDYAGKNWSVYGVGHYDQKDCRGTGTTPTACAGNGTKDKMNGTAVEVGAKFGVGAFSFQGNVYQGTAIGQQFGAITQFGNIDSWGGWAQASVKMGPKWSAHLFYGMEDPKDEDVLNSGNKRVKNEQVALSTMYSTGPYVFGLEWMNSKLTNGTRDSETGGIDTSSIKGNQISASVWYKF